MRSMRRDKTGRQNAWKLNLKNKMDYDTNCDNSMLEQGMSSLCDVELDPYESISHQSVANPTKERPIILHIVSIILLILFICGYCVEHNRESARLLSNRSHEMKIRLFDCEPNAKTLDELDVFERLLLKMDPEAHIEKCKIHREKLSASVWVNPMHVMSVYVTSIFLFPMRMCTETLLVVLSLCFSAHNFVTQFIIILGMLGLCYIGMHHLRTRNRQHSLPVHLNSSFPMQQYALRLPHQFQHRLIKTLPYFEHED